MPAKIYLDAHKLKKEIDNLGFKIYVTSGGFDPVHVGHLRCMTETAVMCESGEMGVFVVIVNGDGFLKRKKGYSFMTHADRMEIISCVSGVDYVLGWDDGSQTVTGALEILMPSFFTKGGDRDSAENVPEFDFCEKNNCKVLFNVGGKKIRSSSWAVENLRKNAKRQKNNK